MDPLRASAIGLDILLVVTAVLALAYRPKLGGALAAGLNLLMIGVFILGLTHLADTILNALFTIDRPWNSILHRGLNVAGFVFVFIGFYRMRKAFDA